MDLILQHQSEDWKCTELPLESLSCSIASPSIYIGLLLGHHVQVPEIWKQISHSALVIYTMDASFLPQRRELSE